MTCRCKAFIVYFSVISANVVARDLKGEKMKVIKRRDFLKLSAGLAGTAMLGGGCGAINAICERFPRDDKIKASRPNIILILCDDLGYGDLACYGHTVIQTPVLDKMAADGLKLSSFYVTSPVCSPTRVGFMTGMQPQRWGVHHADLPDWSGRYNMPERAVTVAELLQNSGYNTAHFGKWHMGEPPDTAMPRGHGFDYFFGSMGGRPSSSWYDYARSIDAQFVENENQPVTYPGHVTDVTTDKALDYLDKVAGDEKPFYINMWYNAPHLPLTEKVEQKKVYDANPRLTEKQRVYYGTVTNIDCNVGRILEKLRALGIEKETFIFFTSDNGPETHRWQYSSGSAGSLRGIKTQLWDGGVRVPAIACWPGVIEKGRFSDSLTVSLDWLPTVCNLAGVRTDKAGPLEGMDLTELLAGRKEFADRQLYFEFHYPQRHPEIEGESLNFGDVPSGSVVMIDGRWKLHYYPESGERHLYDMKKDIFEKTDLYGKMPKIAAKLEKKLLKWYDLLPKEDISGRKERVPTPASEEQANRIHFKQDD